MSTRVEVNLEYGSYSIIQLVLLMSLTSMERAEEAKLAWPAREHEGPACFGLSGIRITALSTLLGF